MRIKVFALVIVLLIMSGCNNQSVTISSDVISAEPEASIEETKPSTSNKESTQYTDNSSESSSEIPNEDTEPSTSIGTTNQGDEAPTTSTSEFSDKEQELSMSSNKIENANKIVNPNESASEQPQTIRERHSGTSTELLDVASAVEKALNKSEYGGLYYEKDSEDNTTSFLVIAVLDEADVREKLVSAFPNQEATDKVKYKQVEYSLGTLEAIQSNLWKNFEKYGIQSCGISIQRNRCTVAVQSKEITEELHTFLDTYVNAGCVEITYNNEVIINA